MTGPRPMSIAGERANHPAFDVEALRRDFPILHRSVHGKPLVFLDSAASAQKPQVVIDAVNQVVAETRAAGR